MANISVNIERS